MASFTVDPTDNLVTIQGVINGLSGGDDLTFLDGTYNHTTDTPLIFSGNYTQANPILVTGESNTGAILDGGGYSVPESGNQTSIVVSGSWINMQSLVVQNFSTGKFDSAVEVYADNCTFEEMRFLFNYGGGLFIGVDNSASNITVKHCLVKNSGAFTGLAFRHKAASSAVVDNCWFIECVSMYNGFSNDGVTLFGDSPGNADGVGISKEYFDLNRPLTNSGIVGSVALRSADDILDMSVSSDDFTIGNNILFWSGPENGRIIKEFRYATNTRNIIGNLCFDSPSAGIGFGIVTRSTLGSDGSKHMNNSVFNTVNNGLTMFEDPPDSAAETTATKIQNNILWNAQSFSNSLTNADISNNRFSGDPLVVDDTQLYGSLFDLTLGTLTVKQLHRKIRAQAFKWAMPESESSPLYEGGVFNADIHMATADDNATTPADPEDQTKVHWTGSVPQIGAVPYRYIDPPTDVTAT